MLRVFPISLTRAASRWLRNEPTGLIKTWEDRKTKFLNKYCPPGRTAKKMEEINNFQQEPDETLYQAWERFKELLMKCPQHYLTEMQEVILFYNGLDVPTRQILDSRDVVPTKTVADAKMAIQEMAEYFIKWHNGTSRGRSTETSDGLAAIQAQLNSLGREIKKSRQTTVPFPSHLDSHYCEDEEGNYGPKFTKASGASHINNTIPRKEKDPGSFTLPCFINNACFDNALVDLGASVSVMPLLTYLNLGLGELANTKLVVELADRTMKYPKGIAKNVLVGIGKFIFPVDFIILDMPEDIKVILILGRPFLSTARAKIDVYKRKITLRVGEEKIIFKSVRPASKTLVLNRSLDPFFEDYIELNDLNESFELIRNQGDDLMPTIKEGKDMDAYRDEGTGDVIFGEPFLREVSEVDKKNEILHAYQKLKGFYKGVLNLGPNYIRDAKMEE
ncbi:putative reverse transcriptase domain-containing protein [Tanacetum coccineum]